MSVGDTKEMMFSSSSGVLKAALSAASVVIPASVAARDGSSGHATA
jgi:hypothetical protein